MSSAKKCKASGDVKIAQTTEKKKSCRYKKAIFHFRKIALYYFLSVRDKY